MARAHTIPIEAAGGGGRAQGPTRRALVQWLAASAALAAAGCSREPTDAIYSYAQTPPSEAAGEPLYYATAVQRDGYAHGVLVGNQQGRPVKVEGNPLHPASLGATWVFEQAAILQLWDPDRSTTVRRRLGPGADAGHAAASWPEFAAAWQAQRKRAGSSTLRVLSGRITSPTLQAQLATWLERHPGAVWHCEDEVREHTPVHHLERAQMVVGIGGDAFSVGPAALRQAADWARARRNALAAGRPLPRALAIETTPSLFGARADERLALAPPHIEALLRHALAPGGDLATELQRPAAVLAQALAGADARTLLIAGDELGPRVRALVELLNRRGNAYARCITAIAAPEHSTLLPAPASLAALADALRGGAVQTLLILGGNAAYGAPAALGLADAIGRVPFSAHLGVYADETSSRCTWHLPCGHDFEQWADARAFDGSVSLMQPAIAPLYDTRSVHELLALLTPDGGAADGHALLQAHWRQRTGLQGADFDDFWRDSLRHGVVARSASLPMPLPALAAELPAPEPAPAEAARDLVWAVFPPDAAVADGSHSNNGWLQELPRPFSSITWGNALVLGPATALALGLRSGDVVHVQAAAAAQAVTTPALDAPVWVQAGHAEGAATLARGYGRSAAGRVGNGVGVDTAPLRAATAGAMPVALRLQRSGARHEFALTQIERSQHGRDLARHITPAAALATLATRRPAADAPSLYAATPTPTSGPAWAMAIDLDACIACNVCTIACQAENNIPVVGADEVKLGRVMHWMRIDHYVDEHGPLIAQPVPCMHCEKAPCELVCPVGATVHDSEGLNLQVYNRCIGTRFCSNNCPYKVRRFNFRQYSDVTTETLKLMHNPDVTVRSRGVMEKCSYCVQRLSRARRANQQQPGSVDTAEVRTACQAACPTGAIHFGDLHDKTSDIVRTRASPRHYVMLEELNTRPRTTYLARVATDAADDAASSRRSP